MELSPFVSFTTNGIDKLHFKRFHLVFDVESNREWNWFVEQNANGVYRNLFIEWTLFECIELPCHRRFETPLSLSFLLILPVSHIAHLFRLSFWSLGVNLHRCIFQNCRLLMLKFWIEQKNLNWIVHRNSIWKFLPKRNFFVLILPCIVLNRIVPCSTVMHL